MRRVSLAVLLGLLGLAGPAQAKTFVVTTTADPPTTAPCTPEQCSLRQALAEAGANGNDEDDVIVLAGTTYQLQQGALGVPSGATRITVRGAGANATVIQPDVAFPSRVLSVGSGASVTLSALTVRNGEPPAAQYGGNILVGSSATLRLSRARVTAGRAERGGGIAAVGASVLDVSASLIDGNTATGTDLDDTGGGIYIEGQTFSVATTIQDSTITGNSARNGGGVGVVSNAIQTPLFAGVTFTGNTARAGVGGVGVGGIFSAQTSARFQGSIIGGNIARANVGNGTIEGPSNCGLQQPATDEGGNVSYDAEEQCDLGGVHDDPQLSEELNESFSPPLFTIPATSSARDIADCAGRTFDQRGLPRPQGPRCDAGAYEIQVQADPTPTPTPTPPPPPPPPPPTPTAVPTPTPEPTPEFRRSVVAAEVSGTVRVRLRGTRRFIALDAARGIPFGSEVDARRGRVRLTSLPSAGGKPQTAEFYRGLFTVHQVGSITELRLSEKLTGCKKAKRASVAQKKRRPKSRRLWGNGRGKFRTKGQYSAATIRGTRWLVQDNCRSTLTRVTVGSVLVRDRVKRKNIIVRAGKRYVARPR